MDQILLRRSIPYHLMFSKPLLSLPSKSLIYGGYLQMSTIILVCQQLILSRTLGQSFLILTCHCVTFTVSKYLQLDGQAAASFSAFAGFFLNCFPLNCIPCFLSGGDEKQTFTTAGYSHLSNSRGGVAKVVQSTHQLEVIL